MANVFKGGKVYEKLCERWESFVTTKPVLKMKLRKRAMVYDLLTESIELDRHIKEKELVISQLEKQVAQQKSESEKLSAQTTVVSAQLLNQSV